MAIEAPLAAICSPTARPPAEAARFALQWLKAGYIGLFWRDQADEFSEIVLREGEGRCAVFISPVYPGFGPSINAMSKEAFNRFTSLQFLIAAGDDTDPCAQDPNVIAKECIEHFGGTYGIMQPTGDRWAQGSIDRIAGSPWIGKEWCERAHKGAGPFHPEALHMFSDQILKEAAERFGVYWMRRDLTQKHNHFSRVGDHVDYSPVRVPPHLKWCNNPAHWQAMQALYERVKRGGYQQCTPQ